MRTAIVWFRRDLRLADNPALTAATREYDRVLPLFVWAPEEEHPWSPGAAQRWWLHRSLERLSADLVDAGSRLILRQGASIETLRSLAEETGAEAVLWNRLYEPQALSRDGAIQEALRDAGIAVDSHGGSLLFEPWQVETGEGKPFRVFTPFWKACLGKPPPRPPAPRPERLRPFTDWPDSLPLDALELLPRTRWYEEMEETWRPGESGAMARLQSFVEKGVADYGSRRDYPGLEGVSRLSPHLHFGEVSPHSAWAAVASRAAGGGERGAESYLRELGWREFAHHVLHYFPDTPQKPMNDRFSGFPWREGRGEALEAWQEGRTGIPIVDAGMRQLWRTGWMHNRVRMVGASLLVKNLLWSWRDGAAWFWDTLVDADLANNTMGWQWTAGCGADAAPYFRIFNPVLQGERFDPDGGYVRRFVPELGAVPPRFLHKPWEMPESERQKIGFRLGRDYPEPIVDLAGSRRRALDAFQSIKGRQVP